MSTVGTPVRPEEPATARWEHRQADALAAHGLVGVVARELGGAVSDGHLVVGLPRSAEVVRVRIARPSPAGAHRLHGSVQRRCGDGRWVDLPLDGLAALLDAELARRTGHDNPEFVHQVTASRDALAAILEHRPPGARRPVAGAAGTYLDSEQALLVGHPRHPAPKWRCGTAADWYRYAPEGRTAFPLRWLAVPAASIREHALGPGFDVHARTAALLGRDVDQVPPGHLPLPVHPWQFRLVGDDPATGPLLRAAFAAGTLHDLGDVGLPVHPTASVRTLYQPDVDVFLKTSLNVRITNCLRRNAAYELAGAVELTGLLRGPAAEVAAAHPGFGLLAEPASRTVALPVGLSEAFGTIVRAGLHPLPADGQRVHLAGTLAAALRDPAGTATALADLRPAGTDLAAWALQWWDRYVDLLVPPVLRMWAHHGVVLEPHLQNVLVAVGEDGLPVRLVVRDMEGVKLLPGRIPATLSPPVARAVRTTDLAGWNRVCYCLFVNNLVEMAAALVDLVESEVPGAPRLESRLWAAARAVVDRASTALGRPEQLRAVLAGGPLPAKANLLVRWERRADREATYVPFANPLTAA